MSNNNRPRIRDLGIKIGGLSTGANNSITDVKGVRVGHDTIIEGKGPLLRGKGPVRTGVTVIFPHSGDTYLDRVSGAVEWLNGFGECFGAAVVNEFGFIIGPITLTNSFNVYRVADALQDWSIQQHPEVGIEAAGLICLVAECSDDILNDVQGRHVKAINVFKALETANCDAVDEGSIGAGTGMWGFGFKGGIGSSSRIIADSLGGYTVGCLVLTNFGSRDQLIINGVPVGKELINWTPNIPERISKGSCVITIATDAPLSSRQLKRLARRAFLGLARTGAISENSSGDLAIAFSTSNIIPRDPNNSIRVEKTIPDFQEMIINSLFQATTESVEEAVLNSICKAESMTGINDNTLYALPLEEVARIMQKYGYTDVKLP